MRLRDTVTAADLEEDALVELLLDLDHPISEPENEVVSVRVVEVEMLPVLVRDAVPREMLIVSVSVTSCDSDCEEVSVELCDKDEVRQRSVTVQEPEPAGELDSVELIEGLRLGDADWAPVVVTVLEVEADTVDD